MHDSIVTVDDPLICTGVNGAAGFGAAPMVRLRRVTCVARTIETIRKSVTLPSCSRVAVGFPSSTTFFRSKSRTCSLHVPFTRMVRSDTLGTEAMAALMVVNAPGVAPEQSTLNWCAADSGRAAKNRQRTATAPDLCMANLLGG